MRLIVNNQRFGVPSNGNLILPITRADRLDSNDPRYEEPEFKVGYRELFMGGWDYGRRNECGSEAARSIHPEDSKFRDICDWLALMDNSTQGRTGFVNLYYGWMTQECLDQAMIFNDDDIIRPIMAPEYKYVGRLIQLTEPLKLQRQYNIDNFRDQIGVKASFVTEDNFYRVRQLIAGISDHFEQYPRFQFVTSEINAVIGRVYSDVHNVVVGCMLYFGEPMDIEYKQPAPVEKPKKIVVSPWL